MRESLWVMGAAGLENAGQELSTAWMTTLLTAAPILEGPITTALVKRATIWTMTVMGRLMKDSVIKESS